MASELLAGRRPFWCGTPSWKETRSNAVVQGLCGDSFSTESEPCNKGEDKP